MSSPGFEPWCPQPQSKYDDLDRLAMGPAYCLIKNFFKIKSKKRATSLVDRLFLNLNRVETTKYSNCYNLYHPASGKYCTSTFYRAQLTRPFYGIIF